MDNEHPSRGTSRHLSKSRLKRGLQCPKSLYLTLHHPELETKADASAQATLDEGTMVGELARKEFPNGVLVDAPYYATNQAIKETQRHLTEGVSCLFEAAFEFDGLSARVDILQRSEDAKGWNLIEVKSSVSCKPEHLVDVAIQLHILRGCNLPVERVFVMYLNRETSAPDLKNLFIQEEVTSEAEKTLDALKKELLPLKGLLTPSEVPRIDIGPHCSTPRDCPFMDHCWRHVPKNSVFSFPRLGAAAWEYYRQGILSLNDPQVGPFRAKKADQLKAVRNGTRWVDPLSIADAIKTWQFPLYYLDFETVSLAIPTYPGTHPYQKVPFQFSCLVQASPGAPLIRQEYLHRDASDPRQPLVETLLGFIHGPGNVVAYNMGFERGVLTGLAEDFPQYKGALLEITDRLVDPLPIFRESVYEAAFEGSFSIKSVAPAILGREFSYEGMEVSHGGQASETFLILISSDTPAETKERLTTGLLDYCYLDTLAMAKLVDWLYQTAAEVPPSAALKTKR